MQLTIREPGSAITHFIAWLMAAIAALPLILKAQSGQTAAALAVFAVSMILLYGASTIYHSVTVTDKVLKVFRQNRSHDDFCIDRRFLHPGLSGDPR